MKGNMVTLLATSALLISSAGVSESLWPLRDWTVARPEDVGMDPLVVAKAREYALKGGGAGCVVRRGRLILSWGDKHRVYELKSTTKSIGVTAVGIALMEGAVTLDAPLAELHPEFSAQRLPDLPGEWLEGITLRHLATHTAGFDKDGASLELLFEPGTQWSYSDGGPNWLAECITIVYKKDVKDLLFERIFTPLGIDEASLIWRENAYRPDTIKGVKRREFGSGISASVDAMARIGYLYLRGGLWDGRELIPRSFVDEVRRPAPGMAGLPEVKPERYGNASAHYGLLWWNNADGTLANVPRDAFWAWGMYDSLIVVIPSLDIVAARAGSGWSDQWSGLYGELRPFIEPLVASVQDIPEKAWAPVPPSLYITDFRWAPPDTIVRAAFGSDNWPLTWGDDGYLYTAYGDGWGFEPHIPTKLSLGLAKVGGPPSHFVGENLRSPTAERLGDGSGGMKASGMLMVEGCLYMWVRNAGNSQLAWSRDRGESWTWSDWRFTTSFGCPTFLNYGANYDGAPDTFVYVYSPDSDTAYDVADRVVLARVPRDLIADRSAYEFFKGLGPTFQPIWTKDIAERGAVLEYPRRCFRCSISYNAGLGRYFLCQVYRASGSSKPGGLAIYDAPEPWGPWSVAYLSFSWDVDPGESASLPTKWMSADGQTLHLVFSGDDCFSVRKATLGVPRVVSSP